jgi:transcription initiation factor TFIIIB Brf1 subunit/transcription initiation factor TFIIB
VEVLEDLILCASELSAQSREGSNAFRLNTLALFEEVFLRKLDLEGEVLKPARDAVSEAMSQGEDVGRLLEGLHPERD